MRKIVLVAVLGMNVTASAALAKDATYVRMQDEGEYGLQVMETYKTMCLRGVPAYLASGKAMGIWDNLLVKIKRNSPEAAETTRRTMEGALSALGCQVQNPFK